MIRLFGAGYTASWLVISSCAHSGKATRTAGPNTAAGTEKKPPADVEQHKRPDDPDAIQLEEITCGGGSIEGPERYFPKPMNQRLAENAVLQQLLGFDRVSTCAQARAFITVYNNYYYYLANPHLVPPSR
jgi:hypothetical protein